MKNRYLLYLSIVLIFAITLSIFSVSIRFIEKLYSFFETYTSLPIVDVLINFNFLYLSGLILLLYRCWRKAAIKQEELENVINSITPYVLIVADQERNIIMCSSSLKRMYGYEVNEVINRKTDILYSGMPSNPEHNSEILDVLGKEGFYAGLAEGKKKDGKTIPLEIITGNLRGRGGTVSLLKDITQLRRAEEALWKSEEIFRRITASAQDGIIMMDNEGNISYWNDAAEKIFGYTQEEVSGKEAHILFVPERYYEAFKKGFSIFRETGQGPVIGKTLELSAIKKDGSEFPIELSVSAVKIQGKWHSVGIARDITERKQAEDALQRSKSRLKLQIDRMPIGCIAWSPEFRVMSWNPAAEEIFGFTEGEALGKQPYELIVPRSAQPHVDTIWRRLLKGDTTAHSVNENITKDGRIIVCDWTNTPLKEADEVVGVLSMVQDITERKKAEEEYKTILSTAIEGFWVVDMQGRFIDVNDAYCNLLGYSREELLTMSVPDIEAVEKPEEIAAHIRKVMETGGDRFETRHRCKDGRIVDIEVSVHYMKGDEGRMFVFLHDITDRKQIEDELKASEARFRNLVETTIDWVWEVDAQGIYTYASPKIKDILGYEVSEVVGKTPFDLMPPDEAKRVFEIFSSIAAQHKPFTFLENINRHKDGHLVVLETNGVPIFDDDGAFLGYRGFDRDITMRKVMEDALRIKDWAIESSINGIGIADLEGYLTYANNAFFKMWGYDEKEVLGKHLLKFCQKEDEVVEAIEDEGWIGEMKARRKNGSLFDISFSASMVKDKNDNPICMMASFIDITETVQLREKLRAISINDELTGLYNRRGFLDIAERELKIAKRKKRMLVLFFVDLDGLKWVNDTMGHNEGDQALIETGNILKKTFREVDILARFGGDEFVILAIDAPKHTADVLTTRLHKNLEIRNSKKACRYNLSLSIGISYCNPESPISIDELISQADSAMYEQKKSKRKIID